MKVVSSDIEDADVSYLCLDYHYEGCGWCTVKHLIEDDIDI